MKDRQASSHRVNDSNRYKLAKIVRTPHASRKLIRASILSVNAFPLLGKAEFVGVGHYSIVIILFTLYSLRQQRGADDGPCYICHHVAPRGLSPGQIDLMPFIKRSHKQRRANCNSQPSPTLVSAGHSNTASKQGKDTSVNQFVPGRRYQIYSNRMSSHYKQAQYNRQGQQHPRSSEMAR